MVETGAATLLRLAAFTTDPAGGNPAGVWIGAALPDAAEMQRTAAELGFSETAFLAPDGTGRSGAHRVRYFSPAAEVPFCRHATIASGVALAEHSAAGRFLLTTNDGLVTLDTARGSDGHLRATLTSVPPRSATPSPSLWPRRWPPSAGPRRSSTRRSRRPSAMPGCPT